MYYCCTSIKKWSVSSETSCIRESKKKRIQIFEFANEKKVVNTTN
jgi:hypothetical protein